MSTYNLYNEKELLPRIAEGNHMAFAQVFNTYYDRIYQLAYVYCHDADLARDTAQMIFMSVWERRSELVKVENLEAWLFGAAKFQVWRLLKQHTKVLQNRQTIDPGTYWQMVTPADDLIIKQQYELLEKIIASLPQKQQQVFRLARQEGLTYSQIAAQLGIGKETVKEHMAKALKKFRELFQENGDILLFLVWWFNFFG